MTFDFDLSIIIVNYNSVDYLRECLRSIAQGARRSTVEIIVIDNASFDGCGTMIAQDFPGVVFVQSQTNLGFAGANNAGARISRGRCLMFLNPDTEIHEGAIDCLRDVLDSIPDAGMVGGRLLNSDSTLQTSCVTAFPSISNQLLGAELLRARYPGSRLWGMRALFDSNEQPVAVDAVSGACMMAKRCAFEQVGGFATEYFMYGEDLDLCMKLRKAGWNNYYVRTAVVTHHGGKSSNSRSQNHYADVMIRQSVYQFIRKYHGSLRASGYRAAMALLAVTRICAAALLFPVSFKPERRQAVSRLWGKGSSILLWSLGLQRWVNVEKRAPGPLSPAEASSAARD